MNAIEPNENRGPTRVFVEPQEVRVEGLPTGSVTFGLVSEAGAARLVPRSIRQGELVEAVAAAAEALTASDRTPQRLVISCADAQARACVVAAGLGHDEGEDLVVRPESVWQRPEGWLVQRASPYPQSMVVTAERRHPRRPPKPTGLVYRRAIPWLSAILTFRAIDTTTDLPLFHRWMNDPRVAEIWEEAGDEAAHRSALSARAADPHLLPLIGAINGAPFGYFELYWASESRLGPHYDAQAYDRGWHVLIGEEAFRGRPYITAWLPSLMHYIFLDDPRTQRIVGEPRANHAQQIRNLDRAGFAKLGHFDFPHKRALLVMLTRERFFAERLWAPEALP